jgi:hypothetical protein
MPGLINGIWQEVYIQISVKLLFRRSGNCSRSTELVESKPVFRIDLRQNLTRRFFVNASDQSLKRKNFLFVHIDYRLKGHADVETQLRIRLAFLAVNVLFWVGHS